MKQCLSGVTCILCIIIFGTCTNKSFKPYGLNDDKKGPGIVTINSFQMIPGGAIINYTIPDDEDLMYIKVNYVLDTGEEVQKITSIYTDTVIILGFSNTLEKNISLTGVDRYENAGECTVVSIQPGEPSFVSVYESIEAFPTFGGFTLSLKNKDNVIGIDIWVMNHLGNWKLVHSEILHKQTKQFSIRGFDPVEQQFKLKVKDQWGNYSESKYIKLTPLYDHELDRTKFRKILLPTDLRVDGWGKRMEWLWNGNIEAGSGNMCHSDNFSYFPQWFTFDLGVLTKLSRYKYWQRQEDCYLYQHGSVKAWEVWGCAEKPKTDGSWDGWIKLLSCESFKPSGRPLDMITPDDIAYALKGEIFEFPRNTPPVRYIRIKILSTFSEKKIIHIQQMHFWGYETVAQPTRNVSENVF